MLKFYDQFSQQNYNFEQLGMSSRERVEGVGGDDGYMI